MQLRDDQYYAAHSSYPAACYCITHVDAFSSAAAPLHCHVPCPCRAVYPKGVGGAGLARYLQEANKEVEVWLQVSDWTHSREL